VTLPPSPPSIWKVRAQPREEGQSTFEAAVLAIQLLEDPSLVAPLRRAFAAVTARLMFLKGRLRSPEVPASWPV